ncbi:hypothetical protein T265_08765 [Opisthorchis viverrini]|uniref:Uncharacterized protein n=1 Tax=Opisthorchis viverrini TaxID=6198 RepID=A0A075A796_OPIVI|nr:hypothetical protein T265_08765 [Opisthorchis viverrini]KER23319.1 hypothetical protein T265_08765 [Opisthorchis viverrini]
MRRPSAANSFAWKHHKREQKLGSRMQSLKYDQLKYRTSYPSRQPFDMAEHRLLGSQPDCHAWAVYEQPSNPVSDRRPKCCLSLPGQCITDTDLDNTWCWMLMLGEMAQVVRGSSPTSATRLPLSRLGQPGSIPALVLPSGGMAARHRKGATAEGFLSFFSLVLDVQKKHRKLTCHPEKARGILPGRPGLDRGSRVTEVGLEPRNFRSVNLRSNHLGHLVPKPALATPEVNSTAVKRLYLQGKCNNVLLDGCETRLRHSKNSDTPLQYDRRCWLPRVRNAVRKQCLSAPGWVVPQAKFPALCKEVAISSQYGFTSDGGALGRDFRRRFL